MVVRLLVTVVLSGLIGLERERSGRMAGLRTHVLVGLGSALVMLTSLHLFEMFHSMVEMDPGRMAAQVVSGIGFIGAGAILRSQASVRGLTTAASLWVVAGIGLASGCGYYRAAVVTTLLALLALVVFSRLERIWIRTKPDEATTYGAEREHKSSG
jgi:putative Mg2+ transporter-C (MgtC) family protein